jgi:predicted metal-binding membrane protein
LRASGHGGPLVAVLRRQRGIVAGALVILTALGWLYLAAVPMPMPTGVQDLWSPGYLVFSLAMWFLMMVAMMTPSVAPVVLLYDRVMHRDQPGWHPRTLGFLLGYFIVWAGFSVAATLAQAALIQTGVSDAMGVIGTRRLAALVLLAVALYQWSGAKAACLDRCHSPLRFIVGRRSGPMRDLRAGLAHGAWCVGCCGGLMLLLFVGGVMNLAWVAVITLAVATEKLTPWPQWARTAIGVGALLGAAWFGLMPG